MTNRPETGLSPPPGGVWNSTVGVYAARASLRRRMWDGRQVLIASVVAQGDGQSAVERAWYSQSAVSVFGAHKSSAAARTKVFRAAAAALFK